MNVCLFFLKRISTLRKKKDQHEQTFTMNLPSEPHIPASVPIPNAGIICFIENDDSSTIPLVLVGDEDGEEDEVGDDVVFFLLLLFCVILVRLHITTFDFCC